MTITSGDIQRLRDLRFPVDEIWDGLRSSPDANGPAIVVHDDTCPEGLTPLAPDDGHDRVYVTCGECTMGSTDNASFLVLLDAEHEVRTLRQQCDRAVEMMSDPPGLLPVLRASKPVQDAMTTLRYVPRTFHFAQTQHGLPLEGFYTALGNIVDDLRARFRTWFAASLSPFDPDGPERYTFIATCPQQRTCIAAFEVILQTSRGVIVRSPDLRRTELFSARSSKASDLGPATVRIPDGAWAVLTHTCQRDDSTIDDMRQVVAALTTACAD